MTTVILFATVPAADGGVAAALRLNGGTPLERLLAQLDGFDIHVIARPMFASALDTLLPGATVHGSGGQLDDLDAVARIARDALEDVVLLPGELVTQPSPLDRLGSGTAILTLPREPDGTRCFAVRAAGGRVLGAASPYHWVGAPSAYFGEVLRVAPADTRALAAAAASAAELPETEIEDVPALLATALVREGTPVAARDARTQFWARPLAKAEAEHAESELEQYDEGRARLDAAVKANDGFFTTFFVSPYSRFVARAAARLGLTPNQVTVLSMCVGVLAALGFAKGERSSLVAGAVLLQVAFMLDCVDGQLARYMRNFSHFGAWLDSMFDRGKEFLVYAGLAVGAGPDVWPLAAAALSLQTVRHMFEFSYWDVHYKALTSAPQPPLYEPGDRPGPPPPVDTGVARAPAAVHDGEGLVARALGVSRLLDRPPGIHWIKKVIVFPIGERFAAISLTAALFSPRTTFIVLLAWGGIGGVYSLSAHVMHTVARRSGPIDSDFLAPLRDDGLLARAVAARVHIRSRFNWLVPGTIRALEYGLLILSAALAHGNAMRACFALLAVLAFHHYDTVYRLRQQGAPPPAWVSIAGGGWDGRIILAFIALLVAVTTAGMATAAVLLAIVFVGESVSSWIGPARAQRPPTYADEEDENE
jgi:Family of unknown function (DUF5941)/CDP-alcohol phosphatidyltransferase